MAADGSLLASAPKVRDRFTVDEFMVIAERRILGDTARIELMDGRIVETPPERAGHARDKMAAAFALRPLVQGSPGLELLCDVGAKAQAYAAAGVPELWVLDGEARRLHRLHSPAEGRYVDDPPLGLEDRIAVPFGAGGTLAVCELFDLG